MNKFAVVLFLLIGSLCTEALAQDAITDTHQRELQRLISLNLWDDVMLLSTDLIIEYPHLGDGYYYAAMAFYRIGDSSKAEEYLEMADSFDNDSLRTMIRDLRNEMQRQDTLASTAQQIEQLQQAGAEDRAADEWRRLWQEDRQNTDFALNAVQLMIQSRRYTEALEILNHATVRSFPEAQRLINVINQTPEMVSLNNYNSAMDAGRRSLGSNQYGNAITQFRSALQAKPNDTEATRLLRQAEDEQAWANARQTNTIASYEAYVSGNTSRQYRDQAERIIRNSLLVHGTTHVSQNNLSGAEQNLLKLVRQYPQSSEAAEGRIQLCTLYTNLGDAQASIRTAVAQSNAIRHYQNALQMCQNTTNLDSKITAAERRRVNWSRPDLGFVSFTHDELTTYGLSIGSANNRKIGMYITGSLNEALFEETASYTIDDNLMLDGAGSGTYYLTGEEKTGVVDGILGLTVKLAYPLWFYAGGGIRYNLVMWEIDEYRGNQRVDTEWVKNTDQTGIEPVFDAGVMLNIMGFHLRGGVKGTDMENLVYTVGVGFSFR